ncbi:hypothetical protein [Curtobacterium flaccumfaciens]|uniref:hypothetical protein n=1 Tax=Curtobacterium flaccumfaciens TaxID=2035 RepID=UPI003EC01D1D
MSESMPACPCLHAHRRLMDLHEDIHRAVETYMDPNDFRRSLNSAIQNSRGVSFLVQKRKSKWSDFPTWYGEWQARAKANPIMKWGVSARDKVVHEEDLNTLSTARVTLYGERLSEAEDVFIVPPRFTTEHILASALAGYDAEVAKATGTIRVQRSWVDDQLPSHELVSALRELYRGTATLVARAHQASGVSDCAITGFSRTCVSHEIDPALDCFPPGSPIGDAIFDLATGRLIVSHYARVDRADDEADIIKVGLQRYGKPPRLSSDPIEHASQRLDMSKRFLEADGFSGPMLILFGDGGIRLHAVAFETGRPREMAIAKSVELEGAWPFTGAVYASEMWLQTAEGRGSLVGKHPDDLLASNTEIFDADPIGGRDEALIVVAVSSDGRSRVLTLPFGRAADGIVYGELSDDDDGLTVPPFLRPVWRHWPQAGRHSWSDEADRDT